MEYITELADLQGEQIGKTAYLVDEVTGPNFDGIPIKVKEEKRPALDGFAIIERAEGEKYHYGRIESGQEINEDASARKMSRDDSLEFGTGEVREGDRNPKVTRVMNINVLGEIYYDEENNEVATRRPEDLPQTGQKVYEVNAEKFHKVLGTPDPNSDEGLEIGKLKSSDEVPFKLPEEVPARHISILGRTGTGKTHTSHVILEELAGKGIPVITFDVLEDAEAMTEDLGGRTMKPGEDLNIPYSILGYTEISKFAPELTQKQEDNFREAYHKLHREARAKLEAGEAVDFSFEKLLGDNSEQEGGYIRDDNLVPHNTGGSGSKGISGRASEAVEPILTNSILEEQMNDWEELFTKNPMINIKIGHLNRQKRQLVIAGVSRMLQNLREEEEIPPFVLSIDEAHKYIPAGNDSHSTQVIRELIQTARHIGVGVILISQNPSALDQTSLKTCNTHIVLSLASDELSPVKGLFGDLSNSTLERIPKLEKGLSMIASSRDMIKHTATVSIRDRYTSDGAETPVLSNESNEWFEEDTERKIPNLEEIKEMNSEGDEDGQ